MSVSWAARSCMPPAAPASRSLAAWPAPAATQVSTGLGGWGLQGGPGQARPCTKPPGCHCLALRWLAGLPASHSLCFAVLTAPTHPARVSACLPACRRLLGVPHRQAIQAGAGVPLLPGCVGRGLHPVLHRRHMQDLPLRVLPGHCQALPSVRRHRLQRVQPGWLLQDLPARVLRCGGHRRGEPAGGPACLPALRLAPWSALGRLPLPVAAPPPSSIP